MNGHAATHTIEETLDPDDYMGGDKVYSWVDKPRIQDDP